MQNKIEVLIIGGGLAGLISALHLHKNGFQVTLIEKNSYPCHKVCGEYISNEVLPYLNSLSLDIDGLKPHLIRQFQLTTVNGNSLTTNLPLGGFGLSRYTFDNFLFEQVVTRGIKVVNDTVTQVQFMNEEFSVSTSLNGEYIAKHVIGAYGKRSSLDNKLNRNFIQSPSPFLAIKGHYKGDFPNHLVSIHNFKGGYCGVSKIENDRLNICYLADYTTFKRHKNIQAYQEHILYQNPNLKRVLQGCTPLFKEPLVISQLFFGQKEIVKNHILMVGDTAGLIHPLCGNGMAMAIHSAKIVAELIIKFKMGEITSRTDLEQNYIKLWNVEFKARLKMGTILSKVLKKEKLANAVLNGLTKFPFLLNQLIKSTHGKPIIT